MGEISRAAFNRYLGSSAAIVCVAVATPVVAQTRSFDVPAQDAARAIPTFAKQAGVQVLAPAREVRGKRTNAVKGSYDVAQGLQMLLDGSGLEVAPDSGTGIVTLRARRAEGNVDSASAVAGDTVRTEESGGVAESDIVVTGTNIAGVAPVGSAFQVLNRKYIDDSGYATTAQVLQSLPQNVRGGADGGSADGQFFGNGARAGLNTAAGTGVNLRGLGTVATLTLINGHRLAPSTFGTLVDISLIPSTAIERIEVLTDGASAIYGADAVAGVVNIILRSDYQGAESRVRYGQTTTEGMSEFRAAQSVGIKTHGGAFMVSGEYYTSTELSADERSFTSSAVRPRTIFPATERFGLMFTGHQAILPNLRLSADALINLSNGFYQQTSAGLRIATPTDQKNFSGNIGLKYALSEDWDAELNYSYSKGNFENFTSYYIAATSVLDTTRFVSANINQRVEEISYKVSGTLFNLPGGPMKLAIGAINRIERYDSFQRSATSSLARQIGRSVRSAFGEIYVPVFSDANASPGLRELTLSGALRLDDYSDFASTTNPRFGASWRPIESLKLRASYGTSFRAPGTGRELGDSFLPASLSIVSVASPTGPGNIPVIRLSGTRPLSPETSEAFSAGAEWTPAFAPALSLKGNYFDIRYKGRIAGVSPPSNVLIDPAYAAIVTRFANNAAAQALVASYLAAGSTLFDSTAGAFGPTPLNQVAYLVDSSVQNLSTTRVQGVDFGVNYATRLGAAFLTAGISGTKTLMFKSQLSPSALLVNQVDTYGNPASFSLRANISAKVDSLVVGVNANRIGGYDDSTITPFGQVDAYSTVDLNVHYDFGRGLAATLAVTNLFDASPPYIVNAAALSHYDAANASPLGRLIAVEIVKRW
jgi:iron complex outermembrane receptor protein